jgi:hypothetical protein
MPRPFAALALAAAVTALAGPAPAQTKPAPPALTPGAGSPVGQSGPKLGVMDRDTLFKGAIPNKVQAHYDRIKAIHGIIGRIRGLQAQGVPPAKAPPDLKKQMGAVGLGVAQSWSAVAQDAASWAQAEAMDLQKEMARTQAMSAEAMDRIRKSVERMEAESSRVMDMLRSQGSAPPRRGAI